MTDAQAKQLVLSKMGRKTYGPVGDAELARMYKKYHARSPAQQYCLLKSALRRQNQEDHFYSDAQGVTIEQKVGCLEYEYLIMKGLILPVLA